MEDSGNSGPGDGGESRREKKHRSKRSDLGIQIWIPKEMLSDLDSIFDFMRRRMEDRNRTAPASVPGKSPSIELVPSGKIKMPRADLMDDGKFYTVRAEIPGVPKENVELSVTEFGLEIKAELDNSHDDKKKMGFVRRERRHSSYFRSISFPVAVVPDKAEATMTHGVLEVTIPKEDISKSSVKKKVEIK